MGPGSRQRREGLLLVTFVMLALSYALLNPYLQSPDETGHVDLVRALEQREGWPDVRGRRISEGLNTSRPLLGWDRDAYRRTAEEAPPRTGRPTFEELEGRGDPGAVNHITQHPPLYYLIVAGTASFTGVPVFAFVEASVDRVVSWYRTVNAVLVGLALLGTMAAVKIAGGGTSSQLVAGCLFLAVPQLTYLAGSVNNDNGLIVAFGLLTPIVMRVVKGEPGTRSAAVGGLLAGSAVLMKVFGIAAVAWLGIAYLVAWVRHPSRRRAVVREGLTAMIVAVVVGGGWWVRNLLLYGSVQPAGMERDVEPLPGFDHAFDDWIRGYVPRMLRSFFGNFGYLDVPLPLWLVVFASVGFASLLVVSAVRTLQADMLHRFVLLVPLVTILATLASYNFVVVFDDLGGRFAAAQGRYWFGALAPTIAFVALTVRDRRGPAMTLAFALLMQLVAFAVVANAFYEGQTFAQRLVTIVRWSPWHTGISSAIFVAAIALLGAVAFVVARHWWSAEDVAPLRDDHDEWTGSARAGGSQRSRSNSNSSVSAKTSSRKKSS